MPTNPTYNFTTNPAIANPAQPGNDLLASVKVPFLPILGDVLVVVVDLFVTTGSCLSWLKGAQTLAQTGASKCRQRSRAKKE